MKNFTIQLLIIIIGALFLVPGLGNVHLFDWDEINFAESAREMIVTGNYLTVQINFEPFWEKPPLFIWMQVLSMKIFGINELAARFPNVLCGILTLLVLFNIGKKLKNEKFGLIWVLMYFCSFLPFFYFKSGIIDPWFNLFIFTGIYYFILFTNKNDNGNKYLQILFSAMFLGLAVLTKGPVGFLIFLLTFLVYFVFQRFRFNFSFNIKHILLFITVFTFFGGFWFLLQILNGNFNILKDFVTYQIRLFQTQDAGHGGFFMYHFVILLFGVFPASIIALPTFRPSILKDETDFSIKHFFNWMMILFWVVLLLFTIVRTKIIHYSSMCFFPLTFLGAYFVCQILENKKKVNRLIKILLLIIAFFVGTVAVVITFFDKVKHIFIHQFDEFTQGNLSANAEWYGFEWIFGIILIVSVVMFIIYDNKGLKERAFYCLTTGSLLFVSLSMYFITPQVEKYTQSAIIEFYKSKQGEDCYIHSKFKSYAPYFYAKQLPENKNDDTNFLHRGKIDKPCYFVLRNTESKVTEFMKQAPDAILLYEKNGFVFFVRWTE